MTQKYAGKNIVMFKNNSTYFGRAAVMLSSTEGFTMQTSRAAMC